MCGTVFKLLNLYHAGWHEWGLSTANNPGRIYKLNGCVLQFRHYLQRAKYSKQRTHARVRQCEFHTTSACHPSILGACVISEDDALAHGSSKSPSISSVRESMTAASSLDPS
eukprot:4708821-Prymnesium_polylepis.1